jgi:hypothetical protein
VWAAAVVWVWAREKERNQYGDIEVNANLYAVGKLPSYGFRDNVSSFIAPSPRKHVSREREIDIVIDGQVGLSFFEKKIISRNTEQDGTEGSSVGIPPVSRKRNTSELCSKPFLGRQKP